MSEVRKEIINRLTKLVDQRKNLAGEIKYDNCIVSTTDLDFLLNMINEDSYISKQKVKDKIEELDIAIDFAQKDLEEKYNELMDEYHKKVQEVINLEQDIKILQDDFEDKRLVYIDTPEFQDSYIPKQKIKDKIEDLEKKMGYEQNEKSLIHLHKQRKILNELLEDK